MFKQKNKKVFSQHPKTGFGFQLNCETEIQNVQNF